MKKDRQILTLQEQGVKDFFDRLAPGYSKRYSPERPFHRLLFTERLERATEGRALSGKAILDIGAGTGPLYDYLLEKHKNFDYYACDLSADMLAQSNIPQERQFIGRAESIAFPLEAFDFIFALGLTTYLTPLALQQLLRFISVKLQPEGMAILSFTHSRSLEWGFQRTLRPLFRKLRFSKYFIAQPFATLAFTPAEVKDLLPSTLEANEVHWLTPTLPILNRIFPIPAAALARKLSSYSGKMLYSDFLLFIQKKR